MDQKPKTDLSVDLCGVRFLHPFVLAAGPSTDEIEMVRDAFRAGWAGAVLKTTSVPGAKVDLAYPMMSGIDAGSVRAFGMGNIDLASVHHIDVIEARVGKLKAEFTDRRVIVSISGKDRASWQEVAGRAAAAGADMIEASFSCPQGDMGLAPGAMLGQDAAASAEVAGWIKKAAGITPIIIKLTPQVADIAAIALAVKSAGADAVCVGNTVPALMGVDIASGVPFPNVHGRSTYSGLSGPAIKPISLRCVAEVAGRAAMPIAASGGVVDWRDAVEFILLGASVVQFCTAVMQNGYGIVEGLVRGLTSHLEARGASSPGDLIGAALSKIVDHDALPRGEEVRPTIDEDRCTRCGRCMVACRDGAHRAIELGEGGLPKVDDERCTGCALCSIICPEKCIEMKGG